MLILSVSTSSETSLLIIQVSALLIVAAVTVLAMTADHNSTSVLPSQTAAYYRIVE